MEEWKYKYFNNKNGWECVCELRSKISGATALQTLVG